MKLRSSILFGCLLVVPLVAMFSHKIPRGVREGFRDRVWRPAVERVTTWVGGESDQSGRAIERSAFAPVSPVVQQPAVAAADPVVSAASEKSAPPPAAPVADKPVAGAPVVAPPVVVPSRSPPVSLPAVAIQSTLVPQPSRGSLDERLAALGAVGLKVKLPDDPSGVHVASCRVPVDTSGQLQRLFQASGPTHETSLERLAVQIEAWRSRVASAEGGSPGRDPASAGPSPAGRRR